MTNVRLHKLVKIGALVCLFSAFNSSLSAQVLGIKRVPLLKSDISIAGRETLMALVEIAPGVSIGRHTHPGDEIGYVQVGEVEMFIDGNAPRRLLAGEAFVITAGKVHDARNIGTTTARVIVTYIVEKGQPLAIPAN